MIVFPNAKINIGLDITARRSDGFHDIETVFYPVRLCDCLEFVENHTDVDTFVTSGIEIPSDGKPNLVQKALNIVRRKYDVPPLDIHLLKKIPTGAGLGGGSSDGAFMINALDYYYHFGIPENERLEMAASLGSDCAFFIKNTPSFATGRGEVFSEISMPDNLNIVIVKPDVSISTPMAYSKVKPQTPKYSLKESVQKPVSQWKDLVKNDFEEFLFPDFPLLGAIKQQLYESGAVYASMTGSGSALFGIFDHEPLLSEQLNKILIL
ncbi:MAG: 4-(cytidine 5'-diphospho)-2-C-methyl-D-erythritol kinase [Bacteroidales bacterium]|nr:4-(cytidine 5'-diphospho)-2-C-methyl-D-erythritol kinase [Bacteroidales bacterium]